MFSFLLFSQTSLLFTVRINIGQHLTGLQLPSFRHHQTLWKNKVVSICSFLVWQFLVLAKQHSPWLPLWYRLSAELLSHMKQETGAVLQTPVHWQLCWKHPFVIKAAAVAVTSLVWRSSASLSWNCAKTAMSCCSELELWPCKSPLSW